MDQPPGVTEFRNGHKPLGLLAELTHRWWQPISQQSAAADMEARIDLLLEKVRLPREATYRRRRPHLPLGAEKTLSEIIGRAPWSSGHVVARLPSRVACSRAAAHSPDDEPQSGPHHRPPRRAIAAASGAQGEHQIASFRQTDDRGSVPRQGHISARAW